MLSQIRRLLFVVGVAICAAALYIGIAVDGFLGLAVNVLGILAFGCAIEMRSEGTKTVDRS